MQAGKVKREAPDAQFIVEVFIVLVVALLAGGIGHWLASDYEKLPFEQKYDALTYDEKRDVALIFLASGLHRYGAEVALCNDPFASPVVRKGKRK